MLLKVKPANGAITNTNMPETCYITLLSEQILEIKDPVLKVFD